jgi:hypothetical protein
MWKVFRITGENINFEENLPLLLLIVVLLGIFLVIK